MNNPGPNFSGFPPKRYPHATGLWRSRWVGYLFALGLVALVSGIVIALDEVFHFHNTSIVYLVAVLTAASAFGSGPAVVAAIASVLAYDWFFAEPLHTLTIADSGEWVSLLLFLLTAIVTGQLAAGQRRRAQEALDREREAIALYDVVRLLDRPDLDAALGGVAARLQQELELAAVVIEVEGRQGTPPARAEIGDPGALKSIQDMAAKSTRLLGEGPTPSRFRRGSPGRWVKVVPPRPPGSDQRSEGDLLYVVPVKARDRRIGTLMLALAAGSSHFSGTDDRFLSTVASQLGVAAERNQLWREATETEILRRTDELKTALLNAVSHDLRTPLASIVASAGSLQQTDVSWTEKERQTFVEEIEQEAQRLNRIVGNLLDLSRVESGSLVPEKGWYDFGALVDDVLGRLRHVTANHRVSADVPEDLPPVPLDYVEIDQVLTNLIENATKYTPAGTEIGIRVRILGSELNVEITDKGPGIPVDALPRLFEPYYRVDGRESGPRGTGLGLAVARGLVEAHGGKLWAENRRTGGARFVFTLPLGSQTAESCRNEK